MRQHAAEALGIRAFCRCSMAGRQHRRCPWSIGCGSGAADRRSLSHMKLLDHFITVGTRAASTALTAAQRLTYFFHFTSAPQFGAGPAMDGMPRLERSQTERRLQAKHDSLVAMTLTLSDIENRMRAIEARASQLHDSLAVAWGMDSASDSNSASSTATAATSAAATATAAATGRNGQRKESSHQMASAIPDKSSTARPPEKSVSFAPLTTDRSGQTQPLQVAPRGGAPAVPPKQAAQISATRPAQNFSGQRVNGMRWPHQAAKQIPTACRSTPDLATTMQRTEVRSSSQAVIQHARPVSFVRPNDFRLTPSVAPRPPAIADELRGDKLLVSNPRLPATQPEARRSTILGRLSRLGRLTAALSTVPKVSAADVSSGLRRSIDLSRAQPLVDNSINSRLPSTNPRLPSTTAAVAGSISTSVGSRVERVVGSSIAPPHARSALVTRPFQPSAPSPLNQSLTMSAGVVRVPDANRRAERDRKTVSMVVDLESSPPMAGVPVRRLDAASSSSSGRRSLWRNTRRAERSEASSTDEYGMPRRPRSRWRQAFSFVSRASSSSEALGKRMSGIRSHSSESLGIDATPRDFETFLRRDTATSVTSSPIRAQAGRLLRKARELASLSSKKANGRGWPGNVP